MTQFSFEILPPWWRAFWFQLAAAIASSLLIVLVAVWHIRKRRARRRDRERQQQEHEALVERATRDSLTGLWNRPAILDILAREIESCRERGTSLAVAIIDIDHFKSINDTRGHLAGDEVLTYAGSSIRVTASFGVAWLTGNADTEERLLSRADEALYGAKQAGRNRVEYAVTG